ncbi:MAG: PEGA domain-containing protein [Lachnospiraceae bacterium]|jgi:hypothetical protein|nr:PEGA domain-containing protein [Lachnospiraceae bacterium]MEE3460848.1 PEGA domain-containing protein [Lachnospiraceae bacterium]
MKRLLSLTVIIFTAFILASCGLSGSDGTVIFGSQASPSPLPSPENLNTEEAGIIINVEDTLNMVTMRKLSGPDLLTLNFDSDSLITNKFGQPVDAADLEIGMVMNAVYDIHSLRISSLSVPEDVWEYKDDDSHSFLKDQNMLNIAEESYQYDQNTYISTGGVDSVSVDDIDPADVITVRGRGIKVYSIVVSNGHGTITFRHYKPFIGGMATIGRAAYQSITRNMSVDVPAGTYSVLLSNAGMTAEKEAVVRSGRETVLDFSEYKAAPVRAGTVKFNIEPYGALLSINGVKVNYQQAVPLKFGSYTISASLDGYNTYSGLINVSRSSSSVNIRLSEASESSNGGQNGGNENSNAASTSDPDSDAATKQIDSDHVIKVNAPEGASVYLDNVYKGIAPCSFTKVIGSRVITLSMAGYSTKSYQVDILDDGKDSTLSFPALQEESPDQDFSPASPTSSPETGTLQ